MPSRSGRFPGSCCILAVLPHAAWDALRCQRFADGRDGTRRGRPAQGDKLLLNGSQLSLGVAAHLHRPGARRSIAEMAVVDVACVARKTEERRSRSRQRRAGLRCQARAVPATPSRPQEGCPSRCQRCHCSRRLAHAGSEPRCAGGRHHEGQHHESNNHEDKRREGWPSNPPVLFVLIRETHSSSSLNSRAVLLALPRSKNIRQISKPRQ